MTTTNRDAPVTLTTGRIVTFQRLPNGAREAIMADGGDMTESEWQELCGTFAATSARTAREVRRRRDDARAKFIADHPRC